MEYKETIILLKSRDFFWLDYKSISFDWRIIEWIIDRLEIRRKKIINKSIICDFRMKSSH